MSPCDFQKDSMLLHIFVLALKTIRVILSPWTWYFDYLGTDYLLDVNALAARKTSAALEGSKAVNCFPKQSYTHKIIVKHYCIFANQ